MASGSGPSDGRPVVNTEYDEELKQRINVSNSVMKYNDCYSGNCMFITSKLF